MDARLAHPLLIHNPLLTMGRYRFVVWPQGEDQTKEE